MPAPPRTSVSGVSANNIIEGSRKRARLEADTSNGQINSPASSSSRLPDASSSGGPEAEEACMLGFKLLDVLINRIDEDDSPLTVPFLALPSKADYPDYYELIKNPVSLEAIRRRLQGGHFSSFEQVRNAFETVCRNAKRYNQKGSEIYEKARTMHQIILHAYVDLVEKGEVQPLGDIVLKSNPPLQQQSARLAKLEKPSKKARLDYDEVEGQEIAGQVSLRLKKDDDIDYEEDKDQDEEQRGEAGTVDRDVAESVQEKSVTPLPSTKSRSDIGEAKVEPSTPQPTTAMTDAEEEEGEADLSSAQITYDGEAEIVDGKPLDRSMLTLAGKFDRRKRPGPRGKRLKSTLRHLMAEMKNALDRNGLPITRFFYSLPSRLQYPGYYKVIQRPIALDSIEDKVMKKDYPNPHALITDLRQMVENAQYFNEEGSEVWEAAEEVRHFVETMTVPTLLADGFTLDPDDLRQSALPVDIAANSTVPAQAAAYRIQMERRRALENGTSSEIIESVSPELPSRSAGALPDVGRLKVRLSRGATSASPAPVNEMQPPVPAPSSAGLGLSVNDGMMAARYGSNAAASFGAASIPATPSSYLNTSIAHSSPSSMPMWAGAGPAVPGGANGYFGAPPPGSQPSLPGRQPSTSMAPPGYQNGSLPFQKPTNVQMHQQSFSNTTAAPLAVNDSPQSAQPLSKRLPGEPPLLDLFRTNALELSADRSIVRQAVISHFDIRMDSKTNRTEENLAYKLVNDVTRIHSINVRSNSPEMLEFQVEMTPRAVVQKEGEREETEDRMWTVSVHHNGKGVKPRWEGDDCNGAVADEGNDPSTATPTPAPTPSTRVQVQAGTRCRFVFVPHLGANIVNIHIHPPPPISALQEIVKGEKHPLRAKAKALLDLPERYRILVYCHA